MHPGADLRRRSRPLTNAQMSPPTKTTSAKRDERRARSTERSVRRGASGGDAAHFESYSAARAKRALRQGRAFGHDARGARDRVGEIEIVDPRGEGRRADLAACAGRYLRSAAASAGAMASIRGQMRDARPRAPRATGRCESNGSLAPSGFGQRAQDRPILARVARREHSALGELRAPFHVDVGPRLFRIGRAGQDHVGAMRAPVAVRADIDDEGARLDFDFVGAEVEEQVERAGLDHRGSRQSARARHQAEIEAADARGGAVQHIEAVPAFLDDAEREPQLSPRAPEPPRRRAARRRRRRG